jgi:H+/gluconate symporter-like permease
VAALAVGAGWVLEEEVLAVAGVVPMLLLLLEDVEPDEVVAVTVVAVVVIAGEATSAAMTSTSMSSKASSAV